MGTSPTPWLRSSNQQPRGPQSDYTRQVAEGGIGALQQARQQRRYGLQGAQQNYGETGVFSYAGPTAKPNDMYDQWLAEMTPQGAPDGSYAYGRTEDGAYAGFKNQGTLQAALRGRAETIRGQDQEMFQALDQMANQGLDQLDTQYRQSEQDSADYQQGMIPKYADAQEKVNQFFPGQTLDRMGNPQQKQTGAQSIIGSTKDAAASAVGNIADAVITAAGGQPQPRTPTEPMVLTDQGRAFYDAPRSEQSAVKQQTRYVGQELQPWLANESAPLLEQQDFAQSGLATPIAMYAQRAGAEYGVDPNIVAGWYPNSSALTDARDQRDLQFLEQTGMTSSDYEQALAALEREQAAATEGVIDQQAQDYDAAGYELTGGQATTSELANATNLPLEDVYNILDSADYQTGQQMINDALSTQDLAYIEETMTQVLDGAAFSDPALLNIFQTIYKDYIPSTYDLYGQR